jgi:hypothetical protein
VRQSVLTSEVAILAYWAAATLILHLALGQRYGWHPDELAMLDDSRHLAWGYPAYPPLTAFLGRVALLLFGHSLTSYRFFAALVEGGSVLMTGLIARELGARRGAQMLAAFAATPWCLLGGTAMRYSSFDYFFWVLSGYPLVDSHWRGYWPWLNDEVHNAILRHRPNPKHVGYKGTALPCYPAFLVRGGCSIFDFSPQSSVASAASFHIPGFPAFYSSARCRLRTDDEISS